MTLIRGNTVTLRPLQVNDYMLLYKWTSDKEVTQYSLSKWMKNYTKKQIKAWLEATLKDTSIINFGIVENSTNNLLGYAGISRIMKTNKSGEYFILIGDKASWGKGYGTEVTKLILNYGFITLKLHRIGLTVSEPNIGGIRAYIKAGFKQEGILRDAALRNGTFHNKIVMSIFNSEYSK